MRAPAIVRALVALVALVTLVALVALMASAGLAACVGFDATGLGGEAELPSPLVHDAAAEAGHDAALDAAGEARCNEPQPPALFEVGALD